LTAVESDGNWLPAIKLSESISKIINPGYKNVWRIYDNRNKATADLLSLANEDPRTSEIILLRHPTEQGTQRSLSADNISHIEPLLVHILKQGKLVYDFPEIDTIRTIRDDDINRLDPGVKRLLNPHRYHISLTQGLFDLKKKLIHDLRSNYE
jgi:nicotinate phosphoribosyltransferase